MLYLKSCFYDLDTGKLEMVDLDGVRCPFQQTPQFSGQFVSLRTLASPDGEMPCFDPV